MIVPNMRGGGAVRHIQRGHVTYDPGIITLKTTVRLTKGDLKNIVFTPYSALTLTMADCGFTVFQGGTNESLELKSNRSNGMGNVTINEIKNRKRVNGSPIYLCIPDQVYLYYKNSSTGYSTFGNNNTASEIITNILYPKLLNSVYSVNDIGSIQITLTGFKALDKMGYVFTNLSQDANKELCKIESFTPNKLIYASEERTSIDTKPESTDCIYGWMNDVYGKPRNCCFEPINMDYWEFFNGASEAAVIWLKDNCPDSIEVLETTYTKSYAVKTKMFFDYQVIEYF